MTFYNVISALLFIGAFRQLLVAFDSASVPQIFMAGTLAILVFNDAVFISNAIECEKTVSYKLNLMLIDLANFVLLAIAMITINPTDNAFGVSVTRLTYFSTETLFWLFLGIYWLLVMLWTYRSGLYQPKYPRMLLIAAMLIAVIFFIQSILAIQATSGAAIFGRIVAFGYTLLYIAAIRPIILHQ